MKTTKRSEMVARLMALPMATHTVICHHADGKETSSGRGTEEEAAVICAQLAAYAAKNKMAYRFSVRKGIV